MERLESFLADFAALAWGPWLLVLLLGGGIWFLVCSRLLPFRYLGHAVAILRGRVDDGNGPGDISHFQALSSALAGTIGMGNIAGVAVAISLGGPGAIFWMWVTAIIGIATKFFTCTLAVMYRGRDSAGHLQGGPMYVIVKGLGPHWRPLALLFAAAGMVGCLPALQANQLIQTLRELIFLPNGWITEADSGRFNVLAGTALAVLAGAVIFGGLQRIARVASAVVPFMTMLYIAVAAYVMVRHAPQVPGIIALIIHDGFSASAAGGGLVGTVIANGVRRGAFSNEAGIGTEAMAHGAARTPEPVREGLVAMLGPIIDTLLICTATAVIILLSGVWTSSEADGVTLTALAFDSALPMAGRYILITCIFFFGFSTILTYTYYGTKCLGFLAGARYQHFYNYIVVALIVGGASVSLNTVINLIDGAYALMAIPTMTSALLLSPKVMAAARDYFARLEKSR